MRQILSLVRLPVPPLRQARHSQCSIGADNESTVIKGIEHTAIAAADVAALADWYVSVLGFDVPYRSANAIFVRAADGTMIEIIQAEGSADDRTLKSPGLRHLALTVDDFDAAYTALKAAGVRFVAEPLESKGNRVVFFTDPEGNYLHLLYRAKPLGA